MATLLDWFRPSHWRLDPDSMRPEDFAAEKALFDRPWLTSISAAFMFVLWIVSLILDVEGNPDRLRFIGYGAAADVWTGKYWVLLASPWIHTNGIHLGTNLFWFWLLGRHVELLSGRRAWILIVLASALVSSGLELAVSAEVAIGISGVVYAFVGFLWAIRNRYPRLLAPMMRWLMPLAILSFITDWAVTRSGLLWIATTEHLGGLALGMIAGLSTTRPDMRRTWRTVLVLVVLASLIPIYWAPWHVDFYTAKGIDAGAHNDYEKAVEVFSAGIELFPEFANLWLNRAVARGSSGDVQGALEDCEEVVRLRPENPDAYRRRAWYRSETGDLVGCIDDCTKTLALGVDNSDVRYLRASAYFGLERYAEAIPDLDLVIAWEPDASSPYMVRAEARGSLSLHSEAISDWTRAIERDPVADDAFFGRAFEWLALSDLDRAVVDMQRATALDSADGDYRQLQGIVEALRGETDWALDSFREACRLDPGAVYPLLWVAALIGDTDGLEKFAGEEGWHEQIAGYFLGEHTEDDLLRLASIDLLSPDHIEPTDRLCEAHAFLGIEAERLVDWSRARDHYQAAVETGGIDHFEYQWSKHRLGHGPRTERSPDGELEPAVVDRLWKPRSTVAATQLSTR